jgi:hypothetical protein
MMTKEVLHKDETVVRRADGETVATITEKAGATVVDVAVGSRTVTITTKPDGAATIDVGWTRVFEVDADEYGWTRK